MGAYFSFSCTRRHTTKRNVNPGEVLVGPFWKVNSLEGHLVNPMPSSQQPTIKLSHSQICSGYMLNSALRATVFHPQGWMMIMECLFLHNRPCCFGFSQMDLRLFGLPSNRKMIRPQLWVPFCSMHCVELPRPFL